MDHIVGTSSPEVLTWLELVLAERLGLSVKLSWERDEFIVLSIDGRKHVIKFDCLASQFRNAHQEICMSWWDGDGHWELPLGKSLPAPGLQKIESPLIEQGKDGFIIKYDMLGLMYWAMVRIEEIGRGDLDQFERFPAKSSHAFRNGYLHRPVVDEWIAILKQILRRLWPDLLIRESQFQVLLSHDVDMPSRYGFSSLKNLIRRIGADILKYGRFKSAFLAPIVWLCTFRRLSVLDYCNTFDWLMTESERRGLKSAFYFICGRTSMLRDADYDIEHPAIRDLFKRVHKRGHEIGLHPSFNSFKCAGIVAREAEHLRRICKAEGITQSEWGGRMHYLRWSHPFTMREWEAAGMTYDSTLGYADCAGFRCGTCHEYPAFDPLLGKVLNLRIRPLVAMESTVMEVGYMGLGNGAEALAKFLELKNSCKLVGGCFTLLWHNSSFPSKKDKELYKAILD